LIDGASESNTKIQKKAFNITWSRMQMMVKISENHFRVTIFGSARIKRNDRNYKLIFELARRIATEGLDIVTGGGPGIMDAANRGHHSGRKNNKLHSVGLTISLPKEQKQSKHLDIKRDFKRFSKRLDSFVTLSNAVVLAPGGVGTMLEFFYVWQLMQVKQTCDTPIIFLGDMWKGLLIWIKKYPLKMKLLNREDLNLIFLAKNCDETMKIIKIAHQQYQSGGKNICININKYKLI
jgi:uncharacterized protein (TIGR00730 family)